jgi:hypothetical protein
MSTKIYLYFFLTLVFVSVLIFSNFYFGVKQIDIDFLDSQTDPEVEITLRKEITQNANSLFGLINLDEETLTKLTRDEHEIVKSVGFHKKFYFNNFQDFGIALNVVVSKNIEYFVACVEESARENFLVWSMIGNSEGEMYKEVNGGLCDTSKIDGNLLKLTLSPKSIFTKSSEEKVLNPDSLSGGRIYTKKDFQVLKELVSYLQKNEFQIKNIYVGELKIIAVDLGEYVLKLNLEKASQDSVADFETISRAGKLQKYINEERGELEYIDLSFKDKVFFKLKNNTRTGIMSSTTATSTSN